MEGRIRNKSDHVPLPQNNSTHAPSRTLKPICCRHEYSMSFENNRIAWKEADETQTLRCYHCDDPGCCVRYTPAEGYFTVVETPDAAHFVEEPGVNLFQCPRHGAWMYRCKNEGGHGPFVWRCGIEDCDYSTAQRSPVSATG